MSKTRIDHKEKILKKAKELEANTHAKPATPYFFKPLSPFHSYLDGYLTDDESKKQGERYHRSEHFQQKDTKTTKFYNKKMANGDRAHLGAYTNNFERTGDFHAVHKTSNETRIVLNKSAVKGDAKLYDELLKYKHSVCEEIATKVGDATYIKAGFYNKYPCLMVYIKPESIHRSPENTYIPSDAALEAWSDFLISAYVGYVNFHARKNNLDIELVRRSSFGFLSPTIAVTGTSFRLNVGIVPAAYVAVLIDGLKQLNQALADLHNAKKVKPALPADCFYGKDTHVKYLTVEGKQKYLTPELSNIFQLLWQQTEKGGKTTLQNIVRTSFSRDGLAAKVYESLSANPNDLYAAMTFALEWVIRKVNVIDDHLTFEYEGEVTYPKTVHATIRSKIVDDTEFWNCVMRIVNAAKVKYHDNVDFMALLKEFENAAVRRDVTGIYKKLELMNEYILLAVAMRQANETKRSFESGYGSDSEDEESFDDETIYTKKLIVSNGMRAILATLLVIGNKLKNYSLYLDAAYYEVYYAMKLLELFETTSIIPSKPSALTTANAYLYDVNACVTNGASVTSKFDSFVSKTANKILVLDTTSATTDQMHEYVERFSNTRAKAMIFVSSGLKNEQLGADRNAYGTIRLFTKDKKVLDGYYTQIKQKEPALDSPISHEYRRELKQLGAVPTARSIFK